MQYLAWGSGLPVGVWATAVRWLAPFFGASFVLVLGRLCNITKHKPISKRVSCRRRLIIPCARGVRGEGSYVVARCGRSSSYVEHPTKLTFSYCSLALSIRACNSGVIVYSSPSKGTRTKACFRPLRIITSSFIAKSKYFFWLARNSFVLMICMVKLLV